jgi:hypothetical protein
MQYRIRCPRQAPFETCFCCVCLVHSNLCLVSPSALNRVLTYCLFVLVVVTHSCAGRLADMATQMGVSQATGPLGDLSKGVQDMASMLGGQVSTAPSRQAFAVTQQTFGPRQSASVLPLAI